MQHRRSGIPSARAACVGLLLVSAVCPTRGQALRVEQDGRRFVVTTGRLKAVLEDGCITGLTNVQTGEVHADPDAADLRIPFGMGHLTGAAETVAKLHIPWGTRSMNQEIKAGTSYPTMHHPHAGSALSSQRTEQGVAVTWRGLANGIATFPDETLTVTLAVDGEGGELLLRADVASPEPGVYGVQVPVANLAAVHRIYVPSFGGVMYDRDMRAGLTTLGGTPFWEAPVIAAEGEKGSLCLWTEDRELHPNFCFLNWSGETFSAAIEHLNLMPFEPHRHTQSVTWRLDVFGGGWVDAMTPYRTWYATAFEPEFRIRNAVTWADRIQIIVDHFDKGDPAAYRALANLFDPDTVVLHDWNARAPDFDHDLPDWTPRPGYVERVQALQALGFKTMAYVNTYCVNLNSPVFVRDRIADFGLTRKMRGLYSYTASSPSFETARDGQLLYLDPLSARWRKYHTDMMIQWRGETGTDANYEDVGGATGDFGNGVVDGRFGAQGGVEQFRELLRRNPAVPMASEYAPDAIAFAVRWPLRFQQVWGNDKTREFWMTHQRPVSAYIHGPLQRPWVPIIRAESNFLRHVVVACSDALGGLAQFSGDRRSLEANQGILVHMKWRAQLFSRRQLQPYFTPARREPDLACLYQDRDGGIYRYYAGRHVQKMIGPDGRELYSRVTGLNRVETSLNLPGWPAFGEGCVIGLNPAVRYALVPGTPDRTSVRVSALPDRTRITRFYETPKATVLCLARPDDDALAEGEVGLTVLATFATLLRNGVTAELPTREQGQTEPASRSYRTAFPVSFVFLKASPQTLKHGEYAGDGHETGRYIVVDSGLDRGGEYVPQHRAGFGVPGQDKPVPFTSINYGSDAEVVIDYLVRVPDQQSSLRVFLQNRQSKYGNGTIARLYVNGVAVREHDFGPTPNPDWEEGMPKEKKLLWDTSFHRWTVPLGHAAQQPVLVSLATDSKASNNADNQWWSRPTFVKDPAQEPEYARLADDGTTTAE